VYIAEFQVEPGRTVGKTEAERTGNPRWLPDKQAEAAIQSLLLGLRFRGWLGDSEKDFLDLLAPEHSVTFLIRNREYLHPERVPLFPMDLIESALNGGGQAIFTHRYEPETATEYDCYKVHTARISPPDRDELILGVLGPDNIFGGPAQDDRFGHLVEQFRRSWRATDDLEERISSRLAGDLPVMLLNRASGRVLTASQQLAEMMQLDLQELVDVEYSELVRRLSTGSAGMKLQLENLSTEPIQMCVATVLPVSRAHGESSADGLIADFFLHTMRNKLAGITAAASHLGSLAEEVDAREEVELADIVLGEAGQLDRELDRLLTLLAYDRLPRKEMIISESISEAVERVLIREGSRAEIEVNDVPSARTFKSPPPALSLLLESVLMSHLNHQRQTSHTRIKLKEQPSDTELRIITEMAAPHSPLAPNQHWQVCASRLARLMACDFKPEMLTDGTGFISTLRIPNDD